MYISRWRFSQRYLFTGLSLLFFSTLYLYSQFFQQQLDFYDENSEQPTYCDQTIIRKHFMNNQSPKQLFEQEPIRTGFNYEIINELFCSLVKPHALIFVVSKSRNYDSRNAIRRTWGNLDRVTSLNKFSYLHLKLLFLIDIDETCLLSINLEQALFQDLVQVRLPQHYTLSTFRDMAMLHWTETYCPEAIMTVKTDDDIILNTYLLANVIGSILTNMTSSQSIHQCNYSDTSAIIYGVKIQNANVVRNSNDPYGEGPRYIVANDEYPCKNYPLYMSGFGYIVNRNARSKLLCTFFRDKKPFHISDVYVTGILPEYIGIQRKHLGILISYQSSDNCENFFLKKYADNYACASSLHYNNKQVNVFERFNTYWKTCLCLIHYIWCATKNICTNRILCPRRQLVLYPHLLNFLNNDYSLCSQRSAKRGPHQRVIGVSAYLSKTDNKKLVSKVWTYLLEYIEEAKEKYPDWIVRVYYYSLDISEEEILRMENNYKNVDFCDATNIPVLGNVLNWLPGKMQRFLPIADPLVDIYMSRDIDSPILEREAFIVRGWLDSQQTIHIIRDHHEHSVPILGGLWGIKLSKERSLVNNVSQYLLSPDVVKCYKGKGDQNFLEDYIWPHVTMYDKMTLEFDSFFCERFPNSRPFPIRKESPTLFIGCRRPNCTQDKHPECPKKCRPAHHPDWIWC
ncbi:unnamed protein product [Rotaria sp. Silwood2]|nr:unnamed protein product [Rotaria sp. Silwood2]CAF2629939.1 unnamed protein product [Rotaria sp. Silwood2]CAF3870056.1 unnamed protein product [Rotaria sp. Silwood2]CAF4093682.1 unnamed protein product [Rotaria sp. Silwood2]